MNNTKLLEQYLFELEVHLRGISPVDRSTIIIEINNHIDQALLKFPEQGLKEILDDLGNPQKVANHYRLNKGLKLIKPKRRSFLKWLVLIFISSIGLFLAFIVLLVWNFTSQFGLTGKDKSMALLGGLVDVNFLSGRIKILDQYHFTDNNFTNQFDGSIDFPKEETDELVINFKSGIFQFTPSSDDKLTWNCKLDTPPTESFLNKSPDTIEIDLESFEGANCDISIPSNLKLTVDGKEGKVIFTDPEYDIYLEMENGSVTFNENPEVDYNYDLKVKNGSIDSFNSVESPESFEIKIFLESGSINK